MDAHGVGKGTLKEIVVALRYPSQGVRKRVLLWFCKVDQRGDVALVWKKHDLVRPCSPVWNQNEKMFILEHYTLLLCNLKMGIVAQETRLACR